MDEIKNEDHNACGCKSVKHIQGIACEVKNCVHHDGETYCTAGKISVGPSFATSNSETACVTFKQRED